MKNLFVGKISLLSRALVIIASLLLLLTYFFPMWRISLWAPQYPEGLSLFIWADKLSGDVQTVNILNHYIGMAHIEDASFPELQFFPKIFTGLFIMGLLVAAIGRKWGTTLFAISNLSFASWAMVDFYNWEYQFGHNLNPDAAIKMEDMVYQPPLIGEKLFLNITASSWPDIAGFAFSATVAIAIAVLVLELLRKEA